MQDKFVNKKMITVKTVSGSVFEGSINIELQERLSDMFTTQDSDFIILNDVKNDGKEFPVIFINKRQIEWVQPLD
jgi:hypothetical protein